MSEISSRLTELKKTLPDVCTLVAVSKTKPIAAIEEALQSGHLDFGENKVQELVHKAETLPETIRWHMIGHLQRNKVKYIAPFVHLIHGVDSVKLLKEINKQGQKVDRVLHCLLQVHIAEEETKFGFDPEEVHDLISSSQLDEMSNVHIEGLMGMATNTSDEQQIRQEFHSLKRLFDTLGSREHPRVQMNTLSIGMSGDYRLALEEGSNMIRIGSAIFGARNH